MNEKLNNIFETALKEIGVKEGDAPRGLRNHNPGNIEDGPFAKSMPGYCGDDGRFAKFETMEDGINAHATLLGKYVIKGVNTIQGIVERWAPPTEENPHDAEYVAHIVKRVGIPADKIINLTDYDLREKIAIAMGEFENGFAYKNWSADDNPEILEFYKEAGHPEVKHDSTAWCAAFVGAILSRCGYKPTGSLMARSYLKWGHQTMLPVHGCVVIFERGAGLGHVTFFDRWDFGMLRCLGGNQHDEVCFADYPKEHVLGYRVPS